MRAFALALCVLTLACGSGSSPAAPSITPGPQPSLVPTPVVSLAPPPTVWTGVVTNTITGAPIVGYTGVVSSARVTVSAPGFITRDTRASATAVDLIPEAGFDLEFYRQFARDGLNGDLRALSVLTQAPSFFIEVEGVKGFSAGTAAELEREARTLVPILTGGRFQVTKWETGPAPREPQPGWVMIERRTEGSGVCGSAVVGASAGQIWLDDNPLCDSLRSVFAHEIGHALGFWHVDRVGAMMYPQEGVHTSATDAPTEAERIAATVAYARPRGNRDIDIDP